MKPWRTNAPDGLDRDQGAIVLSFGRARKQTEALPSRPESLRNWPRSCRTTATPLKTDGSKSVQKAA